MYERFSDRARTVMQLANQEAQRFNHEYIGTEHILLGLIKEGTGRAAQVLKASGIDLRRIRLEVEKLVQSGPDMVTMGRLPQTPRAKHVIQLAVEEALALMHNYVGTEHLLLGLLREDEGMAAQVLRNLGLSFYQARDEILNLLGTGRNDGSAPSTNIGPATECDVFIPVRRSDGSAVEVENTELVKDRLCKQFGRCFWFRQSVSGGEGPQVGLVEVVVLRFYARELAQSWRFFQQLKDDLKRELRLDDILILTRKVQVL